MLQLAGASSPSPWRMHPFFSIHRSAPRARGTEIVRAATAMLCPTLAALYSCCTHAWKVVMRSGEGLMLPQLGESSYTNPSLIPTSAVLRKALFLALLFPSLGFEAAHKGRLSPYSHCVWGCLRESKQKASEIPSWKLCVYKTARVRCQCFCSQGGE